MSTHPVIYMSTDKVNILPRVLSLSIATLVQSKLEGRLVADFGLGFWVWRYKLCK